MPELATGNALNIGLLSTSTRLMPPLSFLLVALAFRRMLMRYVELHLQPAALSRMVSRPTYKNSMPVLKALHNSMASDRIGVLTGSFDDFEYLADFAIGGQTFNVDRGS